jgi:hypothetical protein
LGAALRLLLLTGQEQDVSKVVRQVFLGRGAGLKQSYWNLIALDFY